MTKPRFKRLILHIGTHKTGTSAIQAHLHQSRDDLTRSGILYPLTGQWGDHSHHRWANAIWHADTKPDALPTLLDDLDRERSSTQADTIFLSTELIEKVPLNPHLQPCLVDLLSQLAAEVTVIAFFRRQDELVESVFKQWVKDHNVRLATPPRSFIDGHDDGIDFHNIVRHWQALAPVTDIRIETNALARSPVTAMHELAGLRRRHRVHLPGVGLPGVGLLGRRSRSGPFPDRRVNPTFDGFALELKWALNRLDLDPAEDSALRATITSARYEDETLSLFDPAHRGEFLDRYQASNDALCHEFGAPPFNLDEPERDRPFRRLTEAEVSTAVDRLRAVDPTAIAPIDQAQLAQ